MKLIKKYKVLIILILVCTSIFFIYKKNDKNNINYTSLGDALAIGVDSFGRIDYGYSDYVKDFLKEQNKLNQYIKSFSNKNMSIEKLYEYILINKKIKLKNREYNIRKTLRETEILTISIGLNDLIYNLNITNVKTEYKLDCIISNITDDFNMLIKEIKKYYPGKIYIIGYYKSKAYNSLTNSGIDKLNKMYKENKDVVYIPIDDILNYDKDSFSNSDSYYPNRIGYQKISQKIISKISKKLEK